MSELQRAMDADSKVAMVQARSLCGDDQDVVHYDGGDLHFLGTLVLRNWYRPVSEAESPDGPVGAGIALCFLVDKAAYEQVGGFDENLFILYEDNEFSYKLRMRGHLIELCPDALCTHKAGTVGLSVRGEARYPGRRTMLHSKNRWYVLFTCMRWRTLLLTAPAQLVYGVVYAGFGLRSGHLGSWLKGKWALLTLLPRAFAAEGARARARREAEVEAVASRRPMILVRYDTRALFRPRRRFRSQRLSAVPSSAERRAECQDSRC